MLTWSTHVWKTPFMSVKATVSMKQDLKHWPQSQVCVVMLWGLTIFVAALKPVFICYLGMAQNPHDIMQSWSLLPHSLMSISQSKAVSHKLIFLMPNQIPGTQHFISTVLILLPLILCKTYVWHIYTFVLIMLLPPVIIQLRICWPLYNHRWAEPENNLKK